MKTYICRKCGDSLTEDDLHSGGHVVPVDDGNGYPVPELCGPVEEIKINIKLSDPEKEDQGK